MHKTQAGIAYGGGSHIVSLEQVRPPADAQNSHQKFLLKEKLRKRCHENMGCSKAKIFLGCCVLAYSKKF
jgi:hypothetical protein